MIKINRRKFSGLIAKGLITLVAATSQLVGTSNAQSGASETPRKGGVIRYIAPYGANFSTLDIHATERTNDEIYAVAIHRSLYKWSSETNGPALDLAIEQTISPDGLVYTYKLRDDAYFHNGRKMTADDIIWSYNRIMDPKKAFPAARYVRIIKGADEVEKGAATEISGLKKIDDFTLEITLKEKVDPSFFLFMPEVSIYPQEEVAKPSFATHPIGLGPFKFVEHVPGSRMVFERWEKFYEPGKPYADKLILTLMSESSARDVAFRNKEIDVSVLGPAQYVAYQADSNLSEFLLEGPEMATRAMGFNPNFKPFSDERVRQAINYGINADLIIEKLGKGKAYRASSWLPISSAAYDNSRLPYPYDPEKAKQLLAEAGYPDGFEFEVTASQSESYGVPILEAVVPMLEKIGVKLKIKPVDSTVLAESVAKGEFQAYMWSLNTGPDPLKALKCFDSRTPQSACNYTQFKDPEFDKLLDDAVATGDHEEHLELLRKADGYIYEKAPVWFFNYNKAVLAYQPWLHGLKPNSNEMAIQAYENLWVDETSPAAK